MPDKVRIGAGTGFQGDRLEPAVILASQGELDYLALECLAERTIALAQLRKLADPATGYDPLLEKRLGSLLPIAKRNGVRIVTNMGAANPLAAGRKVIRLSRNLNLNVKVAVVTGDDVVSLLEPSMRTIEARGAPLSEYEIVSANAYLGADAIVPALATGADVVITGRVADPSLFVAPIAHAFGWRLEYLAVRPEYLQWVVNVQPNTSPGYLMRIMRQQTSEKIFNEFARLKKENPSGDFWAPGYLIMGGTQPHPPQLVRDYINQTRTRQGQDSQPLPRK